MISEANVGCNANLANNISANRGFSSVNQVDEIAKQDTSRNKTTSSAITKGGLDMSIPLYFFSPGNNKVPNQSVKIVFLRP
ncbi:MAG: hypothetical protein A2W85_02000 [Bacteroidetes bacterium GWF2_41_31]|nr:MAG: hypothetical protein A2W85_02000 [Bacteroidetes bacterium GWF2_41_31]